MCQHLVHYNIYYLGLHNYMIRVVCWSFSPSLPSLEKICIKNMGVKHRNETATMFYFKKNLL